MKSLLSWTSLMAALTLALFCAAPGFAQTSMRVDVPFAFTAGEQFLPAGEYWITVESNHMLSVITSTDGKNRCLVTLVPGASNRPTPGLDRGLLSFEKHGVRYVLTGIWRPGF